MVKAEATSFGDLLKGPLQFVVPLFQRNYSWDDVQLQRMWDDVVEIARRRHAHSGATHFTGSLVLSSSSANVVVGIQKWIVVDGQQRLTTLLTLLAAIRDRLTATGEEEHRRRIDDQYLHTQYARHRHAKLLLTPTDRSAFAAIIDRSADTGGPGAIDHAHDFFRKGLDALEADEHGHTSVADIETAVLDGLIFVLVVADGEDDVHGIFEALNDTGRPLTQADLLKNYLFMRLGRRSDAVHEAVWVPLEKMLTTKDLELLFWLDLAQSDAMVGRPRTYAAQRRRLDHLEPAQVEADVRRIAHLATLFATMLDPRKERDPELRRRLTRMRSWSTTTVHPLVLQLLQRRDSGTSSTEEVVRALLVLESYLVRRVITGRPAGDLSWTLRQATLDARRPGPVDRHLHTFLSTGRRYFATDQEVREAVRHVDIYGVGQPSQRRLVLEWLEESYGGKEPIRTETLSIEHVMPQTLSPRWRSDLKAQIGPSEDVDTVHAALVHTLGNLTLTGYNSELGNADFDSKRSKLAHSGIHLNRWIAQQETWGPTTIRQRGDALAERIIDTWPGPDPDAPRLPDHWARVDAVVAAIPAGRWATYGTVARVGGTHPVPLGQHLGLGTVPNAHRVLGSGGAISPNFRWADPTCRDDPLDLLVTEGVTFDEHGRASAACEITAEDLARRAGVPGRTDHTPTDSPLPPRPEGR